MKKTSLGLVLLVVLLLVAGLMGVAAPAQAAPSPGMPHWVDPLPVPPVAQKIFKPGVSAWADYYEIEMRASQHTFNTGLGPATVWTYAQKGQSPVLLGPTIVAQSGRPIVVKWINKLPTDAADFPLKDSIDETIAGFDVPTGAAIPHLHGGHSAARYDGTPMQWWTADGQKGEDYVTDTFTYVNDQPASLSWYHDHTMGSTRFKPYLGLAAGYLIFDKVDNGTTINGQRVPTGYGKYHLPLVLQDKQFNTDGTLFYPTAADGGGSGTHLTWVPEFFADTPVVNGKAYPFLNAEPRRYRLRLLNGSQARFYGLQLKVGEAPAAGDDTRRSLPLWVIGSEGGLLPAPVKMDRLVIAPGERFDVIVDFTGLRGSTVMMTNDAAAPYPDGAPDEAPAVPELMKIKVNQPLLGTDTSVKPANLKLPAIPRLVATPGVPARDVVAQETMDEATDSPDFVLLNGYSYMEPTTDFVKLGTTETWRWINLTGDAHPMHMHLVTFQVVNRQALDVDAYTAAWDAYVLAGHDPGLKPRLRDYLGTNPRIPPAPEEMGYKDTVKAPPGYVTRVRAKFTLPWTAQADYNPKTRSFGDWVYHCHILEHEENDMMRPFVVVK